MKVKDIARALTEFDPELDVKFYSEEEPDNREIFDIFKLSDEDYVTLFGA